MTRSGVLVLSSLSEGSSGVLIQAVEYGAHVVANDCQIETRKICDIVLWAVVSSLLTIDPVATRARLMTYLQLVVLVWLIWEIAWSPERQRALLQAFVLGTCFAALGTVSNYLSGVSVDVEAARFSTLHTNPNELGLTLAL